MPLFDDDIEEMEEAKTQLRLPALLKRRVERIADRETAIRKEVGKRRPVVSQNAVYVRFITDGADAYEKAEGLPPIDEPEKKGRK
jgi:hypothetical protein